MLAVWLSLGCIDTIRFPPSFWGSSSGTWDSGWSTDAAGTVQIDRITGDGCAGDGGWLFSASTDGWTYGATVDLFRASDGAFESHPLQVVRTDPNGEWDSLSSGNLADGVDPAEQVDGVSSRFDCSEEGSLSFAIRIQDRGLRVADCVLWGADPEAIALVLRDLDPGLTELSGCDLWTGVAR